MEAEGRRPRELLLPAALLWIAGLPTYWILANQAMAPVPVLKADRVAYLVVAGLLAATVACRGRRPRLGPVDLAIAVYFAVALASWITTLAVKDIVELKQDADFLLTCFFAPFTAYAVARSLEWTQQRIAIALWVLAGGVGTCLVAIGLVQATYDWTFLVAEAITEHPERAKATFWNAISYSTVLAVLLMPTMFLFVHCAGRRRRALLFALALGLAQCIVVSKSRAVWIGVPLALGLVSLCIPRLRLLSAALVAVLAAQVLLAPALGADPWGLAQRLGEVSPVYNRVAVAATAMNMIRDRPLFGFGLGSNTFRREKSGYYGSWAGVSPRFAEEPGRTHNDLLNVAVLMGAVGLLAYLVMLGAIALVLWRGYARQRLSDPFASQLALVVLASFLILFITGQSHDVMYMSYPQVLCFFLLGLAIRAPARCRDEGA